MQKDSNRELKKVRQKLAYFQQVHPETPLSDITKEDEDEEEEEADPSLIKYYNQNTDEDHSNDDDDYTSKGFSLKAMIAS
jgi:hypothetical protein